MNRLGLRMLSPLLRTATRRQTRYFAASARTWSKVISETPSTIPKTPILIPTSKPPPVDVTSVPTSRLRSVLAAQSRLRSRERQTSKHLLTALRDLHNVKAKLHKSSLHTHHVAHRHRRLKSSFEHEIHLRTELEKHVHLLEEKIAHERSWRRLKEWSWRSVIVGAVAVNYVADLGGVGLDLRERLKRFVEWL
ncbi:hypothetical protein BJ508DRAFT_313828 [Ascobolus immersus RN42]|uniref:Uncharacterized protein n=1 Tax=Ascobolus immersus RN42 TaxID=1160509 RepID=A0A3N4HMT6_ASCIM|nr:hypothetical protein BJ508DRAFT_313828 [Ascobolus immersus RN42]